MDTIQIEVGSEVFEAKSRAELGDFLFFLLANVKPYNGRRSLAITLTNGFYDE